MRPSTLLRIERLSVLVAEFSLRDLSHSDVASLLDCSFSAARNYIAELMDARVVHARPSDGCVDKVVFRLTSEPAPVRAFSANLAGSPGGKITGTSTAVAALAVSGMRHSMLPNRSGAGAGFDQVVVQRDPLVAALFGLAESAKQTRA